MTEEKKTCVKCVKELPKTTEYFRKNATTKDGFEGQCKQCRKKYFEDYRAGKRIRSGSRKDPVPKIQHHRRGPKPNPTVVPTTKATPAEILIALRRGMAQEIVDLIREKYDL